MKLNHLDLYVENVLDTALFFEKHFGFKLLQKNASMGILQNEEAFTLVLSQETTPQYPNRFHIGFMQTSEEAVFTLYEALQADGIAFNKPPQKTAWGLMCYFHLAGAVMVEISYRKPFISAVK